METKKCIKDLNATQLEDMLIKNSEKPFRRKQLQEWLYKKTITDFEECTNLSKPLRTMLQEQYTVSPFAQTQSFVSKDDGLTTKYLHTLADGNVIETVWIHSETRGTLCLSSQVGCKVRCDFCASGKHGFTRNLSLAEILEQLVVVLREGKKLTNVVFMGIGEPLDNFDTLLEALDIIKSHECFNIGARKITVSTSGIPDKIRQFASYNMQVELAISLHAPDDNIRSKLVPTNRKYSIGEILDACKQFIKETNRQVMFEYVMLDGINDQEMHAKMLVHMLKGMLCKINLIPYNNHPDSKYKSPSSKKIQHFRDILMKNHITTTIRMSKGKDIMAACGQLRNQKEEAKDKAQD